MNAPILVNNLVFLSGSLPPGIVVNSCNPLNEFEQGGKRRRRLPTGSAAPTGCRTLIPVKGHKLFTFLRARAFRRE